MNNWAVCEFFCNNPLRGINIIEQQISSTSSLDPTIPITEPEVVNLNSFYKVTSSRPQKHK